MNMIQRIITKWQKNEAEVKEHFGKAPKPKTNQQKLAEAGETFASTYLRNLGWKIEGRNWRSGRYCEIDIIAKDKSGTLVFVEVKSRRVDGKEMGFASSGFDSIDERKRSKIISGALHYLAKHHMTEQKYRFDAVVLYYPAEAIPTDISCTFIPQVIHVQAVF